ncbi:MAG: two-component regulator propeller domain-containing protein, partial [Bacteroidota bacterium]
MTKVILTFILILSFKTLSGAVSNLDEIHFNHLSVEDGLSGNIINKIIEDSYGYIWIGTTNGLNRYDGTNVRVFYHDPQDSSSLSGNNVSAFAVDMDGDLWIGTKKGICRFNYETETFERYLQNGPGELNFITALFVDKKGQIWVGTEKGIFTFDKYSHQFTNIIIDDEITLFAPMCLTELPDGTLLVGLWEKGFYIISENRSTKTREVIELGANKLASQNTIMSALVDKNSTLWMATREGVIKAHKTKELGKSKYDYNLFEDELSVEDHLPDNNTHSLCEDNNGNIWIGTENGLGIFQPATQKNINYFNDPTDPYSLSNNAIRCIFKDSNGNIWIGTYQGGVSIYNPSQQWFLNYFPAINNSIDQKMRSVKVIFQDRNSILWVGTDKGLLKFSENGQLIESYINVPSDPTTINVGGVTALWEDRKGRFWVGTWGGGVHQLNRQTGKFERLPFTEGVNNSPLSQGDVNPKSISEDSKGNLWIGTIRGYLDKYNPESKTFKHFRIKLNELDINAIIKDVKVDHNDNVWLGTEGAGLIKFDSEKEQIIRFGGEHDSDKQADTIPDITDVFSLFFADDDHLWLGTGNGVHVLNLNTMGWTSYTTNDGLPENTVYTIQSDDYGKFWISSISSISSFDPLNGIFTNYDGLEGIRINSDCSFKSKSGWLYFGGVNGINAVNPFTIKENRVIPPIVFTDLKIFNQSVAIGKNSILKKHINLTDKIVIPFRDNNFTIEFAALNFTNSVKNQYKCQLEGFDRDWDQLGKARTARYTNLSPGDYTFHISASNNDGVWNNQGRSIEIEILPPWWKTLLFRLLMFLLLSLVILSLILVRTYQLREQKKKLKILVLERTSEIESQKIILQEQAEKLLHTNQLLEEQKNKVSKQRQREKEMSEKLHEADQMKLRFFTNISHEFRTPLTLIQGPAEMLIKEFSSDPRFAELGAIMHRNTIRMLQLINQFLDLSKIEA